jgi:hypothetical protein
VTFRCPKVVVARQWEHAPEYEAAPSNPEGEFIKLYSDWQWKDIPQQGTTAILCRNNAPIISMALKLLRDLVGVTVLGRDIGKSLINLVKKICGKDFSLPAEQCQTLIHHWAEKETLNALAKEKEEKIAVINDRADCLYAVIDAGEAKNLGDIIRLLTKIFEESAGKVVLSTGHKAKGGEWDTVIHLDPWRIPSKYARKAAAQGNMIPLEQDTNLRYVIETRAQKTLIEADVEHFLQKDEA